jgi:hypothetical protein
MSTTKTRDQLIEMIADDLLVADAGHPLEDEDRAKIDSRLDGLFLELSSRGICEIADADNIPAEWCGALAALGANECASMFGQPRMPAQAREEQEERLRIMVQRLLAPDKFLKTDTALTAGPAFNRTRFISGT